MIDWKSSRSSFKSASRDDDWPAMATLRARERTADLEGVREGPRHIRAVSIVTWRHVQAKERSFCVSCELLRSPSRVLHFPQASREGRGSRTVSPMSKSYLPLTSKGYSAKDQRGEDEVRKKQRISTNHYHRRWTASRSVRIRIDWSGRCSHCKSSSGTRIISMIKLLQSIVCPLRIFANIPGVASSSICIYD